MMLTGDMQSLLGSNTTENEKINDTEHDVTEKKNCRDTWNS